MTEIEVSNEERWFDFHYQYIETGWFDYDRHKTIEAMRKLSERLPEDVLDRCHRSLCLPRPLRNLEK